MSRIRKEFLFRLQNLTGLDSLEDADRIAQVFIGLIKEGISPEASEAVAKTVKVKPG